MKKSLIILVASILILSLGYVLYSKNSNKEAAALTLKSYSLAEVSAHNTEADCFIAINGNVYDATIFIASGKHNRKIIDGCGKDATEMFSKIPKHANGKAESIMSNLIIGVIK